MDTPYQSGDILTVSWDDRPIRVLQTDGIETFYDAEVEEVGWIIAKARTAIYYRTPTRYLNESALTTLSQPFSPKEEKKFDQICRFACSGTVTPIGRTHCRSCSLWKIIFLYLCQKLSSSRLAQRVAQLNRSRSKPAVAQAFPFRR